MYTRGSSKENVLVLVIGSGEESVLWIGGLLRREWMSCRRGRT